MGLLMKAFVGQMIFVISCSYAIESFQWLKRMAL